MPRFVAASGRKTMWATSSNDGDLKKSIQPFNDPIDDRVDDRVGVIGCETVGEKEDSRTHNGQHAPGGEHREGAQSSPQNDDAQKGGVQQRARRPQCGIQ